MEKTCIMCPLGCRITYKTAANGELSVSGNNCNRGFEFIKSELSQPVRPISTLIRYKGGVVAVKVTKPIPKTKIFEVLSEVSTIELSRKPKYHEIVKKDICGTGADLISIQ